MNTHEFSYDYAEHMDFEPLSSSDLSTSPIHTSPIPVLTVSATYLALLDPRHRSSHLDRNFTWLTTSDRSTLEILAALFPRYEADSANHDEIVKALHEGLKTQHFEPDHDSSPNPTWRFNKDHEVEEEW